MAAQAIRICRVVGTVLLVVVISAALLSYLFYQDLRKELAERLSAKVSAVIGQTVDIGDISFGPSAGIALENLRVINPEGFSPGNLLSVKRISVDADLRAIWKGDIHFRRIMLYSPALSIMKDGSGRSNISEGLRRFLSRKGTTTYRIEQLTIESGEADFNNDRRLKVGEINLSLTNLSSLPNKKAVVDGSALWAGVNKIRIDGWVIPGDDPKRFDLSVSGNGLTLSPFENSLSSYHIDAEKIRGDIRLTAAGDTEKGGKLILSLQMKSPGPRFYRGKVLDIGLFSDIDYHMPSDSALIRTFSMKVGKTQVLHLEGDIEDLTEQPSYTLGAKIQNLDLSAFDVMKGIVVTGLVSSDMLRVRGKEIRALPEIEGSVRIKNGSIGSRELAVRDVDGTAKFSQGRKISIDIALSGSLTNVVGRPLTNPSAVRLSLELLAANRGVSLAGHLNASAAAVEINKKRTLFLEAAGISFDCEVGGEKIAGKGSFAARKIHYGEHVIAILGGSFGIGYDGQILTLRQVKIAADDLSLTADSLEMKGLGREGGSRLRAKGIDAAYPPLDASLKGAILSGELAAARGTTGSFEFSALAASLRSASVGGVSIRGRLSRETFSIDHLQVGIGGGTITASVRGLTTGGPFPVTAGVTAEHVDAGVLSHFFLKDKSGYRVSGTLESASFAGTIESPDSVRGRLASDITTLSVLKEKTKRQILKDASLRSEVDFQGKDCVFRANVSVGKVAMTLSGESKQAFDKTRSLQMKAHLAEVAASEIRNAFWGVFPDAFLYDGLEGSVSSDLSVSNGKGGVVAEGNINLKGFTLTGENDEYLIGPVNGDLPFSYEHGGGDGTAFDIPLFERSDFEGLKKRFTGAFRGEGYRTITIGTLRYGFRLLSDVVLRVRQERGLLEIGRFSANIFGGRLSGSAVVGIAEGLHYRAGFILDGMSLTQLCDGIKPIKGYISGMIDGVGMLKGGGTGLRGLIGKADFWTYGSDHEKMKISREFLQKLGGPSLKSYIGDRSFDKGEMSLYLEKGFVIFRQLEISNRNFFGMQDLSVKVAPLSNKISLDDLMWSIVEAANRAGKRSQ
jgi:hypothetical protein